MEGGSTGSTLTDARGLLLRISRILWERDVRDTLAGLEGGEYPLDTRDLRLKPGQDQVVYGPLALNEREEVMLTEHDPSLFRGDWCDCAACRKAARQGFRRNSEPE
jgi:hypothetical protein